MKVGFIGLGIMGASMASNLQKAGYKLVVHDLRRQNAGVNLAAGAQWADSPKAVGEACEVVFTSLPGPPEFEAVAIGKDGLADGMKKGAALFDLTASDDGIGLRRLGERTLHRGNQGFAHRILEQRQTEAVLPLRCKQGAGQRN